MDITCYYDKESRSMKTRPCTPQEQQDIDAARAAGPGIDQLNAPIMAALQAIDSKTPRAVREALITGDKSRVQALEAEAAQLRAQLVKA